MPRITQDNRWWCHEVCLPSLRTYSPRSPHSLLIDHLPQCSTAFREPIRNRGNDLPLCPNCMSDVVEEVSPRPAPPRPVPTIPI